MKKFLHFIEGICQVATIKICIYKKKVLHTIGRICRMVKNEKWTVIFLMLFSFFGFFCFLPKFQNWETTISLLVVAGILLISYGFSIVVWLGIKALGTYLKKY